MPAVNSYPIDINELVCFSKQARRIWTDEELTGLKTFLAGKPEAGVVIKGTNGVRKLRWAMGSRGKSRGARAIYYFRDLNMSLYLIAAYTKNEKEDLTGREKNQLRQMVDELVALHAEESLATIVRSKGTESA